MGRDRENPGAAFLTGAVGPSGDEDLPDRPEREFVRLRRLRKPVAYLALAALALIGVVKLTTLSGSGSVAHSSGNSSGASTAAPAPGVRVAPLQQRPIAARSGISAAAATTSASVDVTVVPVPPAGELVSDDASIVCPGGATCGTNYDLPDAVLAAVRAAYPGATLVSAKTILVIGTVDTTLLYRAVKLKTDRREIDVQMLPYLAGPDSAAHESEGSNSLVFALSTGTGFTVKVTVVEPHSTRPSDLTALHLAQDSRLLATT